MTSLPRDVLPFPQSRVAPPGAPSPSVSVLVVSTDSSQAQLIVHEVQRLGWACRAVSTIDAAMLTLQQAPSDLCCVGTLSGSDTLARLVESIGQRGWTTQIVSFERPQSEQDILPLSSPSGYDVVTEPYTRDVFTFVVQSAVNRSRMLTENRKLRRQLAGRNLREFVGSSPLLTRLRDDVQRLAEQTEHVLVDEKPGCGSAVVAQAIHDAGRRAHRLFLAIDCSILSAETVEEELFGETRPGSMQHLAGRYEQADGGTLFFHHIEQLALPMQRKLVPLLRDMRCEHPVTGERIRSDVRVICSTSADLEDLVSKGLFREDLLCEIRAAELTLPALADRKDDIGLIVEHHLRRLALREGRPPRSLSMEGLKLLQAHHWPGNLIELENVIERACGVDWGQRLTAAMVEPWLSQETADETNDELPPGLTLREMERRLIEATFIRFGGNREKTARSLQIGIRTLSGKLREYGYPPRGGPGSNLKAFSPAADVAPMGLVEDGDSEFRRVA